MSEYKRLISYIYSYPGRVKDKNVGFAKAEVRGGQFRLNMSLKGVYTDTPEIFGVYVMVERNALQSKKLTLLKLGTVLINRGVGQYADILNPENINSTGFTFDDIYGIAVAREDNKYYMMFSMWDDIEISSYDVRFLENDYKKIHTSAELKTSDSEPLKSKQPMQISQPTQISQPSQLSQTIEPDKQLEFGERKSDKETIAEEKSKIKEEINKESSEEINKQINIETVKESQVKQEIQTEETEPYIIASEQQPEEVQTSFYQEPKAQDGFEKIFANANFINAFDDDYYYDCVEVTPEQIKEFPVDDELVVNNTFLLHGYYNFKHILFGRVRENDRHTNYFIGVPGMYCNRERFMASAFGFNNFKKSHRSDYANPYFGYWYQEI